MYLTDEKVAVLGAAGAIGSNLAQTLLASGTASRVSMYDPFEPGLEGAAEEIYHCGFPGANVTWTTDIAEALTGAAYVISSGGAPRKEGMTREDLTRDNGLIAKQLGLDIKQHCPACKFVIIIFNPADITGLTTLVHSGLPSGRVSTLAALDSTRLQTALAQHFGIRQDLVTGCKTYGGHGETMAVFTSGTAVDGIPLTEILAGKYRKRRRPHAGSVERHPGPRDRRRRPDHSVARPLLISSLPRSKASSCCGACSANPTTGRAARTSATVSSAIS